MNEPTFFESEPMRIRNHEWRIIVFQTLSYGRCTRYQWRPVNTLAGLPPARWRNDTDWPRYNSDDTYNGLPRSLMRLYKQNLNKVKKSLAHDLDLHGEELERFIELNHRKPSEAEALAQQLQQRHDGTQMTLLA